MGKTSNTRVYKVKSIDSTNNYAQKLIDDKAINEQIVVITQNQTQGKGYGRNSWESQSGMNLTLSYVFFPLYLKAEEQFIISKAISLGIKDFIELFVEDAKIKWPNDIYVSDNKIAGILIENTVCGDNITNSISGIGININQMDFHSDLQNPISLKLITGIEYKLEDCFELLNDIIENRYLQLTENPKKINSDYIKALYRYKEFCPYKSHNNWFNGRIVDIDIFGRIIIEKESGEKSFFGYKELEYII
ncbi:biotin--[acetyl-CoA-carboxylase] ligase [Bacteroidota bacterium]